MNGEHQKSICRLAFMFTPHFMNFYLVQNPNSGKCRNPSDTTPSIVIPNNDS